jgi:hypothetical protein
MPLEDKQLALRLRRTITTVPVDISQMDVSVRANTVYLTGVVRRLPRDHQVQDLRKAVDQICEIIKQDRGVRDVIVTYLRVVE